MNSVEYFKLENLSNTQPTLPSQFNEIQTKASLLIKWLLRG